LRSVDDDPSAEPEKTKKSRADVDDPADDYKTKESKKKEK